MPQYSQSRFFDLTSLPYTKLKAGFMPKYTREEIESQIFKAEGFRIVLPDGFISFNSSYTDLFPNALSDDTTVQDAQDRIRTFLIAVGKKQSGLKDPHAAT
jgi:hypothetical protein